MYIKEECTNTIVIEKSRFITYLEYCENEEQYKEYLKTIKKKHYDATHVCSAFLGKDTRRSSDDGEPSGTAGVPMLSCLDKHGMENTAAFVVRYFGGIKLGAGGLIRAYSSSVSEAIKQADLVEDRIFNQYTITLNYETANRIDYLLNKECEEVETEYSENVKYTFLTNDEKVLNRIEELTSGQKALFIATKAIQISVK
ncbi:MAG: YigZ family protein [Solobacterium sp.]|nr:YigZ family protein [Solobacterium sp.]MDY2732018.1 YigZ family protein [Erysipelotrichaceae bacterium]MCI7731885.1 YigZ family protein [Solobacterium sp.]MDD5843047.1 YigZ family protein [Solobacterium sp.]MDD5982526.1 YigZ family protein [Solobacterium sp.]